MTVFSRASMIVCPFPALPARCAVPTQFPHVKTRPSQGEVKRISGREGSGRCSCGRASWVTQRGKMTLEGDSGVSAPTPKVGAR
jgi:hypothetical protein